jgi:hypothetical protein
METAIASLRKIQMRTIEPVLSTNSTAIAQLAITTASQHVHKYHNMKVGPGADDGDSSTFGQSPGTCQANVGETMAVTSLTTDIDIYSISQWVNEKMYDLSLKAV